MMRMSLLWWEKKWKQMPDCPVVVCNSEVFRPTINLRVFFLKFLKLYSAYLFLHFVYYQQLSSLSVSPKCHPYLFPAPYFWAYLYFFVLAIHPLVPKCFQLWNQYFIFENYVWQVAKYSWSPFHFVVYALFALAQQHLSVMLSSLSLHHLLSNGVSIYSFFYYIASVCVLFGDLFIIKKVHSSCGSIKEVPSPFDG